MTSDKENRKLTTMIVHSAYPVLLFSLRNRLGHMPRKIQDCRAWEEAIGTDYLLVTCNWQSSEVLLPLSLKMPAYLMLYMDIISFSGFKISMFKDC